MSKQNKKKRRKKLSGDMIFGLSLVVIFVGLMTAFILNLDKFKSSDSETTVNENPYATEETFEITTEGRAYLGSEDAPITIVEYGDYKCSHCQQFDANTLPDIEERLVETGKVKFVFKNFPFLSDDSTTAAVYSLAVYDTLGNDAYWEFKERLFEKQKNLYATGTATTSDTIFDEKELKSVVKSLFGKTASAQVSTAYEANVEEYTSTVKADIAEAKANGVTGTPTVFFNGKRLKNSNDVDTMEALVEELTNENVE